MVRSTLKQASKLLALLLMLLSVPAYAGIGSITEFKGAGQIKRAARAMPAAKGAGIEKNDTVSTNSQGKFKITFVDATTVSITENSKLVIDDFVFDGGKSNKGKLGLKVALGTVRYASGAIAHNNPGAVNIHSPTATIGVRGTDFIMSVDEIGRTMVVLLPNCYDEKDPDKLIADCPTGEIEVATATGKVTLNKPFQATVVDSANISPTPPKTVSLNSRQLNNSLQIATPPTSDGTSLEQSAKKEFKKTNAAGNAADKNAEPDLNTTDNVEMVAAAIANPPTQPELQAVYVEYNPGQKLKQTVYTDVDPLLSKKLIQIGWTYTTISDSKLQESIIILPKNTKVEITTEQDGIVGGFNFSDHHWPTPGTGRPDGTITIIQRGAPPK